MTFRVAATDTDTATVLLTRATRREAWTVLLEAFTLALPVSMVTEHAGTA